MDINYMRDNMKTGKNFIFSMLALMLIVVLNTSVYACEKESVVVSSKVLQDDSKAYIRQDTLSSGEVVESGVIVIKTKPIISTFSYGGGHWDSGTCYSNVTGVKVYKDFGGKRISFIADVSLVDPNCTPKSSRINNAYDVSLNGMTRNSRISDAKYREDYYGPGYATGTYEGYSVTLYVGNGRMWTD